MLNKKESSEDYTIKKIIAFGIVIVAALIGMSIYVNKPGVYVTCLAIAVFEIIEIVRMCRNVYQVDTEIKKLRQETEEIKRQISELDQMEKMEVKI
jgi:hypothetical protein